MDGRKGVFDFILLTLLRSKSMVTNSFRAEQLVLLIVGFIIDSPKKPMVGVINLLTMFLLLDSTEREKNVAQFFVLSFCYYDCFPGQSCGCSTTYSQFQFLPIPALQINRYKNHVPINSLHFIKYTLAFTDHELQKLQQTTQRRAFFGGCTLILTSGP